MMMGETIMVKSGNKDGMKRFPSMIKRSDMKKIRTHMTLHCWLQWCRTLMFKKCF
jgi:hypothetical protein